MLFLVRMQPTATVFHVPFSFCLWQISRMDDHRRQSEADLASDIAFALSRSPLKVKGERIEALRIIAGDVVRHLILAGWRLERRPAEEPHKSGGR